jgi:hypothetical protein
MKQLKKVESQSSPVLLQRSHETWNNFFVIGPFVVSNITLTEENEKSQSSPVLLQEVMKHETTEKGKKPIFACFVTKKS